MITKKKAEEMAKGMNIDNWIALQNLNKCFMCKKFKKPLYVEHKAVNGGKILNAEFLAHLQMTHGLPADIVVDMIADKIYNNEKDKEKMRKFYNNLFK